VVLREESSAWIDGHKDDRGFKMAFSKEEIANLYSKRARNYDIAANLYYLAGFREQAYREMAVRQLKLNPGKTVVEIGCGTGLNFSLLKKELGPDGKIIGVDLTKDMLNRARERVLKKGLYNIELVQSDAAEYEIPKGVNGIISTFAITLVPQYDLVIQRGAYALAPGGRFVILDLKMPERWPMWLVKIGVALTRPFGVTLDIANRHPWESIRGYLKEVFFKELYGGFAYISSGEKDL
jgi:demethylmenaquinone methyltransferase/2-methoxy-6-polyprenyl-1,4-benzoquinol methylase